MERASAPPCRPRSTKGASPAGSRSPGQRNLLTGDTVDEITEQAKKVQTDLIVVGHKHLNSWAAVAVEVRFPNPSLRIRNCSVLVVITH